MRNGSAKKGLEIKLSGSGSLKSKLVANRCTRFNLHYETLSRIKKNDL